MTRSAKVTEADAGTPAVLYAAKSTEDTRGSINTQLANARAMAEREGWEVVGEFSDEGFSAYKRNRGPDFERAQNCAAEAAEERGTEAMLVAQHSDRFARGAGDAPGAADHLGEVYFRCRRRRVRLRSVQDDSNLEDALRAVLIGERNTEDSRRKAQATADGIRRMAERGEWSGGHLPDGYRLIEWIEDGDRRRRVEKDPERSSVFELIWALALNGWSTRAIAAELDRRGMKTQPRREGARPRPFDAHRIRHTLDVAFYAGLVVHRGEVVSEGKWPRYVEPEDYWRLRAERRDRAHVERRKPGRPPGAALVLSGLAICGECGSPMEAVTVRYVRKDGTRSRRYVCRSHREGPEPCPAPPIDAALVDPGVVEQIHALLGDVGGVKAAVAAAHGEERRKLKEAASTAQEEIGDAERARKRIAARIATLSAAGEEAKAEALEYALAEAVANREAAQVRGDAALDALEAASREEDDSDGDGEGAFWDRLRETLGGRLDGARDDIRRLNIALSDFLESVRLTTMADGRVRVDPTLSESAVARVLADLDSWRPALAVFIDRNRPAGSRQPPDGPLLSVGRENLDDALDQIAETDELIEEAGGTPLADGRLGLGGPGGWTAAEGESASDENPPSPT